MDPRTGAFPSAHKEHQDLIQYLVFAGVLVERSPAEDDSPQFIFTDKAKRRGRYLPKKVELNISWGYEIFTVVMPVRHWAKIVAGEETTRSTYGWYEGKRFSVCWNFNCGDHQNLYVTYGDDGGVGYDGNIYDLYLRLID